MGALRQDNLATLRPPATPPPCQSTPVRGPTKTRCTPTTPIAKPKPNCSPHYVKRSPTRASPTASTSRWGQCMRKFAGRIADGLTFVKDDTAVGHHRTRSVEARQMSPGGRGWRGGTRTASTATVISFYPSPETLARLVPVPPLLTTARLPAVVVCPQPMVGKSHTLATSTAAGAQSGRFRTGDLYALGQGRKWQPRRQAPSCRRSCRTGPTRDCSLHPRTLVRVSDAEDTPPAAVVAAATALLDRTWVGRRRQSPKLGHQPDCTATGRREMRLRSS
jgi:hypothetical protein